ncbi:MAG: hypothetical protein RIS47_208 [Bacteroidota bacterium]|jgi:hypothetical protein
MIPQPINFQKVRGIGEVLSDTFLFLKQEFKPFFTTIVYYAGIFIFLYAISGALYQSGVMKLQAGKLNNGGAETSGIFGMFANLPWKSLIAMILSSVVAQTLIMLLTFGFVKNYIELGSGNFTSKQVWTEARKLFLPSVGLFFLLALIMIVTLVTIFLPIYFSISLSLGFAVIVFERKGASAAVNRSAFLIKQNWWLTFGLYFLVSILIGVLGFVFSMTTLAIQMYQTFAGYNEWLSYVYLLVATITNLVNVTLYTSFYVAQSFYYFNLVEQKESPSLLARIQQIN